MDKISPSLNDIIKINVSGTIFVARRSTLLAAGPNSYFSSLNTEKQEREEKVIDEPLNKKKELVYDNDGYIFIERNPAYFAVVLDILQNVYRNGLGDVKCPNHLFPERLDEELSYYGLSSPTLLNTKNSPFSDTDLVHLVQTLQNKKEKEIDQLQNDFFEIHDKRYKTCADAVFEAFHSFKEKSNIGTSSNLKIVFIAWKQFMKETNDHYLDGPFKKDGKAIPCPVAGEPKEEDITKPKSGYDNLILVDLSEKKDSLLREELFFVANNRFADYLKKKHNLTVRVSQIYLHEELTNQTQRYDTNGNLSGCKTVSNPGPFSTCGKRCKIEYTFRKNREMPSPTTKNGNSTTAPQQNLNTSISLKHIKFGEESISGIEISWNYAYSKSLIPKGALLTGSS